MNPSRRILPIGIQSFAKIRKGHFYYVDKTALALALTKEAGYFFLSRPRRFGKSLFLDTLKELFNGNEELFRGLYIHDKWDWTQRFPVIRISFAAGLLQSRAELERRIGTILRANRKQLGLEESTFDDVASNFEDLILQAHTRHGQRVVILIDEYDKPILDNIENSHAALALRDGMKDFYSVLKDCDEHIRFAFLTGVSKFNKVSLFSGLNNLRDITVSPDYSAICGYTEHDVNTVFADELAGLDRDEIRRWYNGYNWLGESVYNPFDLLLLFRERKFNPWWFESATPTFLVKLLTERQTWLPSLGKMEATSDLLSAFDVDKISTAALMFQSGYLTLAGERRVGDRNYYQLGFPNEEVRQSLLGSLLQAWTADSGAEVRNMISLYQLLEVNDLAGLKGLFQAFFASIPHQWFTKNAIADYEGYYASVVYAYFVAAGLDVRAEEATNFGRIDMAVRLGGQYYLFEFKVVEQVPDGKALQQIKDKGYADKYRAAGLPIHLIGIEFSKAQRNVVGFEVESL